MKRSISLAVLTAVSLLVALAGALLVSGTAAAVVTHGVSMKPVYTEGDLVVVARSASYAVGDIVAYRLPEDRSVVLHRIVGGDAAGFTIKGDNNGSIDPYAPGAGQIMGREALHIPQGGVWLERVTSPPALAIITFLLLASGGTAAKTWRRRNRRSSTMSQHATRRRPSAGTRNLPPRLQLLGAVALILGVTAMAIGAIAWTGPLSESTPAASEESRMEFSYSARVQPGPAYDRSTVIAPDPVFRNVVDTAELSYIYSGDPGTLTLNAELSTEGGWRSSVPLAGPVAVTGRSDTGMVSLDLSELDGRALAAATVTGIPAASVNVAVTLSVETSAGAEFRPALNLTLTPLRLSLAGSPDDLLVTGAGTEPDLVLSPRTLGPDSWNITVNTARIASGVMFAASLLLLAAVLLMVRRMPSATEAEAIKKRYASVLVQVQPVALPASQIVVEVSGFPALAKLAERFNLPVLNWNEGASETFIVHDESAFYRYRTGTIPLP